MKLSNAKNDITLLNINMYLYLKQYILKIRMEFFITRIQMYIIYIPKSR